MLLHGLARTKLSMSFLGTALRKSGYEVHNFGYLSILKTIEDQAHTLAAFVKRKSPECRSLSFVTHSLGSLIVRKFALLYADYFPLHRAVMLGPPNQGSQFAVRVGSFEPLRWVLGPAFREICALNMPAATDKIGVGIIAGGTAGGKGMSPFVSGNNDGIVAVAETGLEGALDRIVVPALHSFIMFQPPVIREVIWFLQHGRFSDQSIRE